MRRFLLMAALFALTLFFARACRAQASGAAEQNTPEALKAAYDQARNAKDWPRALAAAQKLVDLRASAENLDLLALAQFNTDANADALATTDRALDAVATEKPADGQPDTAWKDLKSKILLIRGNAYLRLRRQADAIDAYSQSAALASNPIVPLFNICVTYSNAGDMQNGVPACRKAAQADPTRANTWFVLGTLLFGEANLDANHYFAISDECRQALNKYLELAPNGPHAADVKAMLDMSAK
jgi:hypothetical protein